MTIQTSPILNRIKKTKGWKISSFPIKTSNYSRDILLWLKIYLLLKTYLNFHNLQLLYCHFITLENNIWILYVAIIKLNYRKEKRNKHFYLATYKLMVPKSKQSRSLIYKYLLINKMKISLQNVLININKKQSTYNWIMKPRLSTWIFFLKYNVLTRKHDYKKKQRRFYYQNKIQKIINNTVSSLQHYKSSLNSIKNIDPYLAQILQSLKKSIKEASLIEKNFIIFEQLITNTNLKSLSGRKLLNVYIYLKKQLKQKYMRITQIKHIYKTHITTLKHRKLINYEYIRHHKKLNIKPLIRKQKKSRLWKTLCNNFVQLSHYNFTWRQLNKPRQLKSYIFKQSHPYKIKKNTKEIPYNLLKKIFYNLLQLGKLLNDDITTKKRRKNNFLHKYWIFFTFYSKLVIPYLNRKKKLRIKQKQIRNKSSKLISSVKRFRTPLWNKKIKSLKKYNKIEFTNISTNTNMVLVKKLIMRAHFNKKGIHRYKKTRNSSIPTLINLFKFFRIKKHNRTPYKKWIRTLKINKDWKNKKKSKIYQYWNGENFIFNDNIAIINKKKLRSNVKKIVNYRISYINIYDEYKKFITKYHLKYCIQKFLQNYFSLSFNLKLINLSNIFTIPNYYKVMFPEPVENIKNNLKYEHKNLKKQNYTPKKKKISSHIRRYLYIGVSARRFILNTNFKIRDQIDRLNMLLKKLIIGYNVVKKIKNANVRKKQLRYIYIRKNLIEKKIKQWRTKIKKSYAKKLLHSSKKKIQNPPGGLKRESMTIHLQKQPITTLLLFAKSLDVTILAEYIVKMLELKKDHWAVLYEIINMLKLTNFKIPIAYRIGVFGRINSAVKTKLVYFTQGNLSRQKFSNRIDFATAQGRAYSGTIGVKIWIYY